MKTAIFTHNLNLVFPPISPKLKSLSFSDTESDHSSGGHGASVGEWGET